MQLFDYLEQQNSKITNKNRSQSTKRVIIENYWDILN